MKNNFTKKKPKTSRTIEDELFLTGLLLTAAAACICIAAALFPALRSRFSLPPCLFHLISGYYCPGCGGTRAVRALLCGQFLQSLLFHPFVPYAAVVSFCFMATQAAERASRGKLRIGMRYHNGFVWIAVLLIIGNFILKNLLHAFYGWSF